MNVDHDESNEKIAELQRLRTTLQARVDALHETMAQAAQTLQDTERLLSDWEKIRARKAEMAEVNRRRG